MRLKKTITTWNRAMATAVIGIGTLVAAPNFNGIMVSPASAADLLVNTDEATIHRLVEKAATIIIGNPSIADVNIQGGDLLVVMGKTPGRTNIIALNRKGGKIADVKIHVRDSGNRNVTLYLGAGRHSFNCAPNCDRTLNAGDEKAGFDTLEKQINSKKSISQESATAASKAE